MIIQFNNKSYKYTGIAYYYISECGEIISMYNDKPKLMKNFLDKYGYARIALKYELGKERKYRVHRLVYQTYSEEELKDDLVIDHIDGDITNNHFSNLRQCTQKENIKNALNHKFGKNNARKIVVKNKNTGEILEFDMIKELIAYTGIPVANNSLSRLKSRKKFQQNFDIIN